MFSQIKDLLNVSNRLNKLENRLQCFYDEVTLILGNMNKDFESALTSDRHTREYTEDALKRLGVVINEVKGIAATSRASIQAVKNLTELKKEISDLANHARKCYTTSQDNADYALSLYNQHFKIEQIHSMLELLTGTSEIKFPEIPKIKEKSKKIVKKKTIV